MTRKEKYGRHGLGIPISLGKSFLYLLKKIQSLGRCHFVTLFKRSAPRQKRCLFHGLIPAYPGAIQHGAFRDVHDH